MIASMYQIVATDVHFDACLNNAGTARYLKFRRHADVVVHTRCHTLRHAFDVDA